MKTDRLGIGMIGSGFNARFHLHAFVGVRDADIRGIWSPNEKNASEAAGLARSLDVGEPRLHSRVETTLEISPSSDETVPPRIPSQKADR
jgi:ornithine cyclodeaminase/alanine dehydrogenase-like protein (mu-crystallin family)